jgi:alpha-amylase
MAGALVLSACGTEGRTPDPDVPAGDDPRATPTRMAPDPATLAALPAPEVTDRRALAADDADFWNAGTIYFLLTDRFINAETANDTAAGRQPDGAPLRSFLGGDLRGVTAAIEAGWFDALGVNAIWMTPFVEQIHGAVDEGTGRSYGFHGYWTKDWTAVDPALGTADDLKALVDAAHGRGIRVIMDAVLNHTGPVTPQDPLWEGWVRTGPRCTYQGYESTVACTLVDNLPDILTASDEPVEVPQHIRDKWAAEGRLDAEMAELDAWFADTGYPRTPRHHLIKWLTDWVRELGFDGYRMDTAKHFQEDIALTLRAEAERALADWRAANPGAFSAARPFWFMGEVYNYAIDSGRDFDFGDEVVDYYAHGYDALINFGFTSDAGFDGDPGALYAGYAEVLTTGELDGFGVVNYASSHDDSSPMDRERSRPLDVGTRLLLAPGTAQIYYGDETGRRLDVPEAEGDAKLRSFMNWNALADEETQRVVQHWRRLGAFRAAHPAVGAGRHTEHRAEPLVFSRELGLTDGSVDRVLVALDQPEGRKVVPVYGVFGEGAVVRDAYSGARGVVTAGEVAFDTPATLVLLEATGM